MAKIIPCLWFDTQAEEAANFYCSIFPNSHIRRITHFADGIPTRPAGMVMSVSFTLDGTDVQALNGGPEFKFTEAVSMSVSVETQEEIDGLWGKLTGEGGEEGRCGWLKDKFGLSWQVVPKMLERLGEDGGRKGGESGRVMRAIMGMKKIIIADLQAAYDAD